MPLFVLLPTSVASQHKAALSTGRLWPLYACPRAQWPAEGEAGWPMPASDADLAPRLSLPKKLAGCSSLSKGRAMGSQGERLNNGPAALNRHQSPQLGERGMRPSFKRVEPNTLEDYSCCRTNPRRLNSTNTWHSCQHNMYQKVQFQYKSMHV